MKEINSYSFLVIGKTAESTESSDSYKRYVGLASSYVIAVNPSKKELEDIYGNEQANDPEYVVDTENGKEARVTFIVKTDPEQCGGIEIISRAMFTLRNTPAYNRDQTKVQVIDQYGNFAWLDTEDAKAHKKALDSNGNEMRLDNYRMACVGECSLIDFLKNYLCVKSAYEYKNGVWVKKAEPAASEGLFGLEHIKDYFKGDFSELKQAIALQPNNTIKLLYGVRTTDDNKQYQAVCTREQMTLRNNAPASQVSRLENRLADAKASGSFSNIDYKVQMLQEWTLEPTNLETPEPQDTSSAMPWD